MTLTYKITGQPAVKRTVSSLQEAVSVYESHRNDPINGFGGSELHTKILVKDGTTTVARLSYNGRAWDEAGKEIAL